MGKKKLLNKDEFIVELKKAVDKEGGYIKAAKKWGDYSHLIKGALDGVRHPGKPTFIALGYKPVKKPAIWVYEKVK